MADDWESIADAEAPAAIGLPAPSRCEWDADVTPEGGWADAPAAPPPPAAVPPPAPPRPETKARQDRRKLFKKKLMAADASAAASMGARAAAREIAGLYGTTVDESDHRDESDMFAAAPHLLEVAEGIAGAVDLFGAAAPLPAPAPKAKVKPKGSKKAEKKQLGRDGRVDDNWSPLDMDDLG